MGAGWAPLLRSLVNIPASTIVQLAAEIADDLDANFPARFGLLIIEYDINALGNLYVGNSAVSATNCGRHLVAGQNFSVAVADVGVILATDVYLFSDNATNQINITALPIGM